ncbi:MAG: GIY-YIG nuclease family protein [Candidatus Pacebacteria bacterium]|nr:GIY-YIG nuclease family protein [Candidatus Paceibacterota bacterium]
MAPSSLSADRQVTVRTLLYMNYVYFIKSIKNNWVYVGSTVNLEVRFQQHNKGEVKSTSFYKPFDLVYYESYPTIHKARLRERKIKSSSFEKDKILKKIGVRL